MLNTAKQNYPGSVTSYDTWPGNGMGLLYNARQVPKATASYKSCWLYYSVHCTNMASLFKHGFIISLSL